MPRSTTGELSSAVAGASPIRAKRNIACLHCRRQKMKCDGAVDKACSRCLGEGIECVTRPRANAAVVADDLRWQQMVEERLRALTREVSDLRAANSEVQKQLATRPNVNMKPIETPSPLQARGSSVDLPPHLSSLREILRPALQELQRPTVLDVSIEEAAVLWEYFYEFLAIFHGFTASTDLTTPSPLLFSAIVTTSAKRYNVKSIASAGLWEELFQRALIRLLYETRPKTWDDVVGLGIARTWFWKADEITSGLTYGSFVETSVPGFSDVRSRRVWDFLEMTSVSHGILHLSTTIVPDRPPPGVPDRHTSHVLLGALNELFDILGIVNRALTSAKSIVQSALQDAVPHSTMSFAETVVLRTSRTNLEQWHPKWLREIQNAELSRLPDRRAKDFLIDLVDLNFKVAMVIVDAYLYQASPTELGRYQSSARDLLNLATEKWANSLHLWPKLFLHSALIASLIVMPSDDTLSRRLHDLTLPLASILQTTGRQLLQKLGDRLQSISSVPAVSFVSLPTQHLDLTMAEVYNGSDSLWDDLTAALGLQPNVGATVLTEEGAWTSGFDI